MASVKLVVVGINDEELNASQEELAARMLEVAKLSGQASDDANNYAYDIGGYPANCQSDQPFGSQRRH